MFHCLCCGTRYWTNWDDGLHPFIQPLSVNIFNCRISLNRVFFIILRNWCSWESCSFSVKICKCLSFCRNTGAITWFCSVRDFMISVLLIFLFLDSQLFFQRVYNWYIVSIYCQFFVFKSSDLFIVVNSSSMRDI